MNGIFSVYFFSLLDTYKFQYFGKVRRKNCFKIFLSFSKSSFPIFISFTGERRVFRIWREGTCYLLSKDSVPLFPRSSSDIFNTYRLADFCPRTSFFSRTRPGSLATIQHISSRWRLSKNWKALSLFPLMKRVLLQALRLLSSSSLLHPVLRLNDIHSLLCPTNLGLWGVYSLTCIPLPYRSVLATC